MTHLRAFHLQGLENSQLIAVGLNEISPSNQRGLALGRRKSRPTPILKRRPATGYRSVDILLSAE